jgi:ribosomal protein S18 acetylase RimI-like enzyme
MTDSALSLVISWARPDDASLAFISMGVPEAVVRTRIADRRIAVAEHIARPVCALQLEYLWGTRPYIAMIRVEPEFQRRGVGRALLAFVESSLCAEGYDALLSSSQKNEPDPQTWHRRMGFVECGLLTGINEGGVDEIFFRKLLTA